MTSTHTEDLTRKVIYHLRRATDNAWEFVTVGVEDVRSVAMAAALAQRHEWKVVTVWREQRETQILFQHVPS